MNFELTRELEIELDEHLQAIFVASYDEQFDLIDKRCLSMMVVTNALKKLNGIEVNPLHELPEWVVDYYESIKGQEGYDKYYHVPVYL